MTEVEKSSRYWPEDGSVETFGQFEVEIKKKENIQNLDGTILRSLQVKGFEFFFLLLSFARFFFQNEK